MCPYFSLNEKSTKHIPNYKHLLFTAIVWFDVITIYNYQLKSFFNFTTDSVCRYQPYMMIIITCSLVPQIFSFIVDISLEYPESEQKYNYVIITLLSSHVCWCFFMSTRHCWNRHIRGRYVWRNVVSVEITLLTPIFDCVRLNSYKNKPLWNSFFTSSSIKFGLIVCEMSSGTTSTTWTHVATTSDRSLSLPLCPGQTTIIVAAMDSKVIQLWLQLICFPFILNIQRSENISFGYLWYMLI